MMDVEKKKYIEDLREIKTMMNRSSRFISLSGMSGVCAGLIAILTAFAAYQLVYAGQDYFNMRRVHLSYRHLFMLLLLANAAIFSSFAFGVYFTGRKAKRNGQRLWGPESKQFLTSFMPAMVTGGLLCLMLLLKGYVGIVAPLCLVFYGLALVSASRYTLEATKGLGYIEIILGLAGIYFIGYGLLFWALGFGLMHIVYGVYMHIKYGS